MWKTIDDLLESEGGGFATALRHSLYKTRNNV
jgi:hypothetical protein